MANSVLLAIAFASTALGCAELASIEPWAGTAASSTSAGAVGPGGFGGSTATGVAGSTNSAGEGGLGGSGGSPTSYSDAVLADGPIAYWRLGENPGATEAAAVFGPTGSYEMPGLTLGVPGAIADDPDTAVEFDGEGGRVVVGDFFDFAPNQPMSIELWAKPTGIDLIYRFLVSKRSEGVFEGYVLSVHAGDGVQWVRYDSGSVESSLALGGPLRENVFSHVVVASDGTDMSLYVNGMLEALSTPSPMSDTGGRFIIGANDGRPSSNEFLGVLDEVAVYDHALPSERVEAHYKAGIGR